MAENITHLVCSVGDRVKLLRPLGHPPTIFKEKPTTQYLEGFIINYPKIGEFEESEDGYVYYRHKYSGKQVIHYVSDGLGSFRFSIIIDGITVHDHASVTMGGPAFATYFSGQQRSEE